MELEYIIIDIFITEFCCLSNENFVFVRSLLIWLSPNDADSIIDSVEDNIVMTLVLIHKQYRLTLCNPLNWGATDIWKGVILFSV